MRLFLVVALAISLFATLVLTGCQAPECQQMQRCCEAVRDLDGVGPSCVGLAQETSDPNTCSAVLRTIGYMLEDRDQELPAACQ